MLNVIVTDPPRAPLAEVDKLADYGVATVHEAIGRNGYLGPAIRPNQQGARIAGAALTVLCWPGDNLMIHAAVEQARPGDVMVVTTTSPNAPSVFGEVVVITMTSPGLACSTAAWIIRLSPDQHSTVSAVPAIRAPCWFGRIAGPR